MNYKSQKSWIKKVIISASLLFLCAGAWAEPQQSQQQDVAGATEVASTNYYVELGAGVTYGETVFLNDARTMWGNTAINLNGGYQFNNRWALEADLNSYYVSKDDGSSYIFGLAFRRTWHIPADGRFAISLKGGFGYGIIPDSSDEDDTSAILPYLGVGVSYQLSDHAYLTLQASGITVIAVSAGALTAGVGFTF